MSKKITLSTLNEHLDNYWIDEIKSMAFSDMDLKEFSYRLFSILEKLYAEGKFPIFPTETNIDYKAIYWRI